MTLRAPPGTLLVAVPQMLDPNFMHTVVLLCEHTEQGAYGLVVNRRTEITVDRLVPDHPLLAASRFPVFDGGPVGHDTLQFLHRVPGRIPGGVELADGLHVGGRLDALAEYVRNEEHAGEDVRLFLGYSGWGEGQLDAELAIGSWVPAPLDPRHVFGDRSPEVVWRGVLRSLGDRGKRLSDLPPDVSWN